MAKRKFILTEEQDNEVKATYHQCQNGQTKIRYQAVRLYGNSYRVTIRHNHSQRRLDDLADESEESPKSNSLPCSLSDKYGYTQLWMVF